MSGRIVQGFDRLASCWPTLYGLALAATLLVAKTKSMGGTPPIARPTLLAPTCILSALFVGGVVLAPEPSRMRVVYTAGGRNC